MLEVLIHDLRCLVAIGDKLDRNTFRGLVWKVIEIYSDWVVKKPERRFQSVNFKADVHRAKGRTIEHVVPTGIFLEMLAPKNHRKQLPPPEFCNNFIEAMFLRGIKICYVTKAESYLIDDTPKDPKFRLAALGIQRLKKHMPMAWDDVIRMDPHDERPACDEQLRQWESKFADPWVRYQAVRDYWRDVTYNDFHNHWLGKVKPGKGNKVAVFMANINVAEYERIIQVAPAPRD